MYTAARNTFCLVASPWLSSLFVKALSWLVTFASYLYYQYEVHYPRILSMISISKGMSRCRGHLAFYPRLYSLVFGMIPIFILINDICILSLSFGPCNADAFRFLFYGRQSPPLVAWCDPIALLDHFHPCNDLLSSRCFFDGLLHSLKRPESPALRPAAPHPPPLVPFPPRSPRRVTSSPWRRS